MEKFVPQADNPNHGLVIRTDNKWKPFKSGYEVPKKVMKDRFDYLAKEDQQGDGFLKYNGTWHHTSEFMSIYKSGLESEWDGALNYSMSNGLFIKISSDGEEYKIAYFYSASIEHWNELQQKRLRKNPDDEHDLTYEIDGKEVPIINPEEAQHTSDVYLFSFGAYADTKMIVFADSVEKGLEIAASDLKEHEPDAFVSDEEVARLHQEALDEGETDDDAGLEDLTYTEEGYITSYEWFVNELTPAAAREVKQLAEEHCGFEENSSFQKDLKLLTPRQHREAIDRLSKMTLSELRRRQAIIVAQLKTAERRGNHQAVDNLQVMERHVTEAILRKTE